MTPNEPAQSQTVVLAVVLLLGILAVTGLVGGIFLIYEGVDASSVALVFAIPTAAVGALAGILASTRSAPPVPVQQAYTQGVNDLAAIATVTGPPPGAPV